MAAITLRTVAPLSFGQVNDNFTNLNEGITTNVQATGGTINGIVIGGVTPAAGTFTSLSATGNVTVTGNLTVNGTTSTINSSTLTVDDKNIEIGVVSAVTISTTGTVGSITGSGPWTATITGMTSTSGLIVGSAISATNGVGSLGASGTYIVASIVSGTSVTYTATGGTTPVAGTITTITTTGATDVTANGGGLLLKGATDKTILWDSTNSNFTTSENWNIASGKVLKLNNATLLGASNALPANFGGTGVLNNVLNTITFTGSFSLGLTLSANTALTLPTSGTVTALGNTTSGTGSTIVLNTTPSISYLQLSGSTGAGQAPI
jgi:hypothetical protein